MFTKEFYDLVSTRLSGQGIFVQWLPRYLLDQEEIISAAKTLAVVFPNIYAWEVQGQDIILVARKSPQPIDANLVSERLRAIGDRQVRTWRLAALPVDFLEAVNDDSIPVNSDDRPRIEFSSARNGIIGARRDRLF